VSYCWQYETSGPAAVPEDVLITGRRSVGDCKNTAKQKRIQDHIEAKRSKKKRLKSYTHISRCFLVLKGTMREVAQRQIIQEDISLIGSQ
jgi:hypothetical protein